MTEQLRVLVLAGGGSAEREVSLNSGRAVVGALARLGHSVMALDPSSGANLLDSSGRFVNAAPSDSTTIAASAAVNERALMDSLGALKTDVVFLALHGGEGENGVLQTLLDLSAVAYTGSGRAASTVAMDKPLTKQIAQTLGVETPRWLRFDRVRFGQNSDELCEKIGVELGLPVIVKPADSGSTVGLTLVREDSGLKEAGEKALAETGRAMAEGFVSGREMTVSVFDNQAWPVVEIRPQEGLYDYKAKYTSGGSEYFCPADISRDAAETMQEQARLVYEALDCSGLSRVDFILPREGAPQFLELNTIPGMTELSLAPMAAKAAGIEFERLVQMMLDSALSGR